MTVKERLHKIVDEMTDEEADAIQQGYDELDARHGISLADLPQGMATRASAQCG